jgi:hypothetical protein
MDYSSETGLTAGRIYQALEGAEDRSVALADLKKQIKDKTFNYAVGWLLRENKIRLGEQGRKIIVILN